MNGRVGGNFEIYTLSTKYHYFSDAQGELLMEKGNNRNFQQTYTREIEKEWPYEFDFRVDQKEGSGNSEKNEKMWKRAKDMAVELRGMVLAFMVLLVRRWRQRIVLGHDLHTYIQTFES